MCCFIQQFNPTPHILGSVLTRASALTLVGDDQKITCADTRMIITAHARSELTRLRSPAPQSSSLTEENLSQTAGTNKIRSSCKDLAGRRLPGVCDPFLGVSGPLLVVVGEASTERASEQNSLRAPNCGAAGGRQRGASTRALVDTHSGLSSTRLDLGGRKRQGSCTLSSAPGRYLLYIQYFP